MNPHHHHPLFSVALNMQTAGLEMDICDGLFRQNGGCGYVLKPDFLRDMQSSFRPEKPVSPFKAQKLVVQVPRGPSHTTATALHAVDLGSIPDIPFSPLSTVRIS